MFYLASASQNFFLNFYAFGTLLVVIFTSLLALFFLFMPEKSKSTFHIGMAFVYLFFFTTGYFIAAFVYHPLAAYHRWLTGGFILFVLAHFGQFFFKYPRDINPKLSRVFFITSYSIAILVDIVFFIGTYFSDKKYHFTGHYWDFDAQRLSVLLAIIIAIYLIINFLIIPIWKFYNIRTKERFTILKMMVAVLIAGTIPNITNIMSRDGALPRSTYLLSLVIFFVIGFFLVSIFYLNSTRERTTFMAKIVGLTLVSILLVIQAWGFYMYIEQDEEYDKLRVEKLFGIIESGNYGGNVEYIIRLDKEETNPKLLKYAELLQLNLPLVEVDFRNTILHEEIANLPPENFRKSLSILLQRSHPYFIGYRKSLEDFLTKNSLKNIELKNALSDYIKQLNRIAFIHFNKISAMDNDNFCQSVRSYLGKNQNIQFFRQPIEKELNQCYWQETAENLFHYRNQVYKYLRYFKPALTRHYRHSNHTHNQQKHFISYIYYDKFAGQITEVGFSYVEYRAIQHNVFTIQSIILVLVIIFIIVFYPLFFKGSLINPLNQLLQGVKRVNHGNFDYSIPIKVNDEIGFLSNSFNSMVVSIKDARKELQNYAENLEEMVKYRTQEVEERMAEIKKLKIQQDGDYYLTSLLARPLFYNANKSEKVKTEFLIHQKKQFEFRKKNAELGGDICVTGAIRLGTTEQYHRYILAMNGDAMGKSMQGAGGSLVMGVIVNSIMKRSAANDRVMDMTPEQWLSKTYTEVNDVFKAFNGTMVISCVFMLIEENTGEVFYFNAEHPYCVLYRNHNTSFIETEMKLRKIGLDSEFEFEICKFQLIPGDVVIMGSDGRDDLDLTPEEPVRTINEDETLFLMHVKKSRARLDKIYQSIAKTGSFIDDLSLLRIGFQESEQKDDQESESLESENNVDYIIEQSKKLLAKGKLENARILMDIAYQNHSDHLRLNKLYGLICFKLKEYDTASEALSRYIEHDNKNIDVLYYYSLAQKKLGRYNSAVQAGKIILELNPEHIMNLANLADLYRLLGEKEKALEQARNILKLDKKNQSVKKMIEKLES